LHYIKDLNDRVSLIVHFALKLYAITLNFNSNPSSQKYMIKVSMNVIERGDYQKKQTKKERYIERDEKLKLMAHLLSSTGKRRCLIH